MTLGKIRHALHNELWFLSCGQAFIPKGLMLSDMKTALALADTAEKDWKENKIAQQSVI